MNRTRMTVVVALVVVLSLLVVGAAAAGGAKWNKWQPFVNGFSGESKYSDDRWLVKDFATTHRDYEMFLYANDEDTFVADYLPYCEASPYFLYWSYNDATIMKTLTGRDVVNELYGGVDVPVYGCVFSEGYHESQP